MPDPTPADRMALAMCVAVLPGSKPCQSPCNACRVKSAAVAHEIARQLRERYGSSVRADWLDGVGCHPGTVLVAADDVPPVEQEITGNGSGASLPPFSNQPRVGEPLPLYQVTMAAGCKPGGGFADDWPAAEIEALRDWLLPEEAEPRRVDPPESMNSLAITAMYSERQRLRALLTEQAQVAREAGPH